MKTVNSEFTLTTWIFAGLLCAVFGFSACKSDLGTKQRIKAVDVIEYDAEMRSLLDTASLLKERGRIDSALYVLQTFKQRLRPELTSATRWRYYDLIGSVAFDAGSYDLALHATVLQDALPRSASLETSMEIHRAHALKKLGDTVKAIQWYRRILDGTNAYVSADAHRNLAWLFISRQRYDSTLHRLALADSVTARGFVADVTAKAWCAFTRARAYASLGNTTKCVWQLNYGLKQLEKEADYRLGDPRVRRSICQGVMDDSLRFRRTGIPWDHFRQRFQRLVTASDYLLQAETQDYNNLKPLRSKLLRILSLDGGYQQSKSISLSNLDYITDVATDDRGWQWVSAITGTYVRVGSKLLSVIPPTDHGSVPTRSLHVDGNDLRRTYYTGRQDRVSINRYVKQGQDSSSWLTRASHQWSFLPWNGSPATAVTPYGSGYDTLLYVFANTIGFGTTSSLPKAVQSLQHPDGSPWNDTVTHIVGVTPSMVLASTNRGVWSINPRNAQIQRVDLTPTSVNDAMINTIGFTRKEGLLTIEGSALYQFRVQSLEDLRFSSGREVYAALTSYVSQISRFSFVGNNPTDFSTTIIPFNSLDYVSTTPLEYHRYFPCINTDSSYATLYPFNVGVFGLSTFGLSLSPIPISMVPLDQMATLKYCDPNWNVGIVTTQGLIIGSQATIRKAPGGTLIAWKGTGDRLYRVGSDGADIALTSSQREVAISVNRPANYGILQIPLLIKLSWNDSTFSTTTGTEFVVGELPSGEHLVTVTMTDQSLVVPIRIFVEPTLAESRWFQILAGGTVGLLLIVGFQYARLQTMRQKEQQQRNLLEERLAIGRDLHDAVGADLVRINMLTKEIQETRITREIRRAVREANRNLRDIIWSVADPHTLDAVIALLAERIRAGAEEAGLSAEIDVPFDLPKWSIAPQVLRDITLVVTEALTNTIKHADATRIQYRVVQNETSIVIEVIDNGRGFGIETPKTGLGLESMYARAQRSGIEVSVVSQIETGTTVRLEIPQV